MSRRPVRRLLAARLAWCLLVAVLLSGAIAGWTAWQVLQGGQALQSAADQLRRGQVRIEAAEDGTSAISAAAARTAEARGHFEDPAVRLVASLPVVGRPVEVASAVAVSADAAVSDAVEPLLLAAGPDLVERLLPGDGRLDVTVAASLAEPSAAAARTLRAADAGLTSTPARSGIARLDTARAEFATELSRLTAVVGQLALATELAPRLLGGEGVRRYLLVPQNPAESRGTGGLFGGYVLLEADRGRVRVLESGPNSSLATPGRAVTQIDAEFDEHYGHNGPTFGWVNANLSPHFPYAAKIWSTLWERQTGQRVDGVLTLDPVALSFLLEATGPVSLANGTKVAADNVVDLTLRDAYSRYAEDKAVRDAFLEDVVSTTAAAVLGQDVPARRLLDALTRAVDARRLLFWSPDKSVQDALGERTITGRVPARSAAVGDVIVNAAASKLDYYLDRSLTYAPGCAGAPSTLSLRLTNTAPSRGLPDYVSLPEYRDGQPAGTNESIVTLHVPRGSSLGELRLDGRPASYRQGTELGTRWVELFVVLRPGQTAELALDFREDAVAGASVHRIAQPLVRPESFAITAC